jgi:hypothetical protein
MTVIMMGFIMVIMMVILIIIQYRICFNNTVFGPKTSASLQTTLAADAHLAEGQHKTASTVKEACLLIRCQAMDVHLLSAFTSARMFTESLPSNEYTRHINNNILNLSRNEMHWK